MIAASTFDLKFQISDLKVTRVRRRGKSEHQRAASPLTAGRLSGFRSQISKMKFQMKKSSDDDKCNREQTSRRESDFEISNLNTQVMGETVRPHGAISDLKFQISDLIE